MTAHPTSCTIDLGAYLDNLELIGRHVGAAGVCPVVKADAYGHGLAQIVPAIEAGGFERLAVAQIGEAVAARSLGFTGRVLVLSAAVPELVASHDDPDFEHTVPDLAALERVADTAGSTPRRIHLKIDTGMGRLGTDAAAAAPLIRAAVAEPRVEIVGVYTHFANADAADLSDARGQLERFTAAIEEFDRLGAPIPIRHAANSGAIEQLPEAHLDLVRAGILSYGIHASPAVQPKVDVRPVMSWTTTATFTKRVEAGTPVSYGSTWTSTRATNLATLPVGYGDGYRRGLGNRAEVLVDGRRHPIVGRVCMDQMVVDTGDVDIFGRPVVLLGASGDDRIDADELAAHVDTISYEIVTAVTNRVPRTAIGGPAGGR